MKNAVWYTEEEIIREKERVRRNNGNKSILENIPFEKWFYEWLNIKKSEVTASTLADYGARIRKHVLPRIGNISISKINPSSVRFVLNSIEQ